MAAKRKDWPGLTDKQKVDHLMPPTRKRRRKFTLHGPAAGSYVEAQAGHKPTTDAERALRVATLVHVAMTTGHPEQAAGLITVVATDGLEAAANVCTSEKKRTA